MKHFYFIFLLSTFLGFSQHDIGIAEIISPSGHSNCSAPPTTNTTDVRIQTFNPDGYNGNDVTVSYQLNNEAIVQENLPSGVLILNLPYTLSTPITTTPGSTNTLRVWTSYVNDTDTSNDEMTITFINYNGENIFYLDDLEWETETINATINSCWNTSPHNNTTDQRWNIYDQNGTIAVADAPTPIDGDKYFYSTSSIYGFEPSLTSRLIDIGTIPSQLSFDYHITQGGAENTFQQFYIDIYSNGVWTNNVAIINEKQLTKNDPWKRKIVPLDGHSGNIRFRFRFWEGHADGIFSDYDIRPFIALDNFDVREVQMCYEPTNLNISNITRNSTEVNWDTIHNEANWEIEYGPQGFNQGTGTTVLSNTNSYNITGLSTNMSYDVYIRSNCGGTPGTNDSEWIQTTFSTICSVIAPIFNDVENHIGTDRGNIENCWSTDRSYSHRARWDVRAGGIGTPSNDTGPSGPYSGSNYFYFEASSNFPSPTNTDRGYLFSPFIDISGLTDPALEFYYHMNGGDIRSLRVDVFHNNTWNLDVLNLPNNTNQTSETDPWTPILVPLSAFSGEIQLRFVSHVGTNNGNFFDSHYRGDIAIDDIRVDEAANLSNPTFDTPNSLTYYPNPTQDRITFEAREVITLIEVYNILGQKPISMIPNNSNSASVDLSEYNSGIYFVNITTGNKNETIKIIKQ